MIRIFYIGCVFLICASVWIKELAVTLIDLDGWRTKQKANASTGHWEYYDMINDAPYNYSEQACKNSALHQGDCNKTRTCSHDLMNWRYHDASGNPYPRFSADGFRNKLKGKSIVFIGDSTMRQQIQPLLWSLGYVNASWKKAKPPASVEQGKCTTSRSCIADDMSNITICYQTIGSLATKIYHDNKTNYTLDHSLRGHGESSCILDDEMIDQLSSFDLAFVQGVAWWTRLPIILESPGSPKEWIASMLPTLYKDAIGMLLSKLSERTHTILTLGQSGTNCRGKVKPEPYLVENIPDQYNWDLVPSMWSASLEVISERSLNVQVVDAREPLMQSVHAHPTGDCLHFCMNSAAVNIYMDMYWNEVFSRY